ncbi:MAG: hypothetical protein GWP10_15395 [Nitrospiraceae bacterium]|nr:hypothetical protein [Nitrospiraceae bacterium]
MNITVKNLTLKNNGPGVLFAYTNNSRIENVTASNNDIGIWLDYHSSNNNLTNNTASNNHYGISLSSSSNYNTLTNNTASNNCYGIWLNYYSSNNNLTDNTANSNNDGFRMDSSSNNNLTDNNASNNYWGISLSSSSNYNIITCNWMQNNTVRGFYLWESTGNNISYNNIIENGNYNTETDGWEWNFYNDQYQPVGAKHNYWGAGMNNSTIDASIYDDEEGAGKVEFYPFKTDPVPCAPISKPELHGDVNHDGKLSTADAVLALRMAVGSIDTDPAADVNSDGQVTSLDALMILQAAAEEA